MTLLCRFDPVAQLPNITYYWVRTTESEVENVAFGELTLQSAYRYIVITLLKRSDIIFLYQIQFITQYRFTKFISISVVNLLIVNCFYVSDPTAY